MGKREHSVEEYLADEIAKHFPGGICRKWVSPGRSGVPDQICFINPEWFVEVKTADGVYAHCQSREGFRLISAGARVAVVFGHVGVDSFIQWAISHKDHKPDQPIIFT